MSILVFPGVVTSSMSFRWEILNGSAGASWSYQFYKDGAPYGSTVAGVLNGSGTYAALIAPVALGKYEVRFTFDGEVFVVDLQSLAIMEFVWRPDYTSSRSRKAETRETKFGDGYIQMSPIGLNSTPADWSLQFSNLSSMQARQIDLFLNSMRGATAFMWKDPDGRLLKYRCTEWSTNYQDEDESSMSARFVQVFL